MLRTDRDALACDLAETYGIFNMRVLPGRTLATLAAGLREGSRIKKRLFGDRVPQSDMLLAAVVDRLSQLIWMISEDAGNEAMRPKSVLEALLGVPERESNIEKFDSPEDYEAEWTRRTGVKHGR